jgi:YVTN family beta-propeller protein
MKKPAWIALATAGAVLATAAWVRDYYWVGHMRRMSGQASLDKVSCYNCHLVATERLPWAKPHAKHDSPAGMVASADGTRLFIAMDDKDEIAEADVVARRVLRRVRVPGRPFGLALDPAGNRLFVACRDADRVAVLDARTLKETASAAVGMAPVAVAFCQSPAGERLVVANSMSDDVSVLTVSPLAEISRPAAGREPFAATPSPDGARVFVANRMVRLASVKSVPESEVTVVDAAGGRVVRRDALESAHLSEGACTVPARGWIVTPLVKVRNLVPIVQVANGWVMSAGVALTDLKTGAITQVPLDEANDYFSDPSGIVADPAGRRLFIASGGGDVVTVVDAERLAAWLEHADPAARRDAVQDLTLSSEYVVARIPTARNPRHLAISPDGRRLFVAERLQDSVLVVDAGSLAPEGRIMLGDGGEWDPVRRGERVFTSAAYTFQHQFSCRSCHPDGHVDGISYDFDGTGIGDNLLDNRTLLGVAGTEPFKWNGRNPSLEVQCGPRFAKVLMRTDPFPAPQLHDLTTFIKSLPPQRVAREPDGRLTPSQRRGRALFFAAKTTDGREIPHARRCSTCHRPPLYTVRLPFDVGTKGPFDTVGAFDTPHLLGVADTAPYLHDGRALSLEEIWTVYSKNDEHGVTSYMNKIQLNDLVEFLKTL